MQKHLNILIVIVSTMIVISIASEQARAVVDPAPVFYKRAAKQTTPPRKGSKARTAWIICKVFGRKYCNAALDVAWCESDYVLHAKNGQFIGVFQMGSSERKTFGHGKGAWRQAIAAKKYFDYSVKHNGDGFHPWSCKPSR